MSWLFDGLLCFVRACVSERVRGAELQVSELESVSVSECESLCESLQAESGRECECGNEVSEQEGLCQDPF